MEQNLSGSWFKFARDGPKVSRGLCVIQKGSRRRQESPAFVNNFCAVFVTFNCFFLLILIET